MGFKRKTNNFLTYNGPESEEHLSFSRERNDD